MFSILHRYIFKQFMLSLGATMATLLVFFVLVRFTEEVNHFVEIADETPFKVFVQYFVYEMPYTFTYLFPIGVMFVTVFVLGRLNSQSELCILFTTGKSIIYYLMPVFVFLTIVCTIFFIFDKELFYVSHQKHRVLGRALKNQTFYRTSERHDFVQFGSDNKIYMIRGFNPVDGELRGLSVVFLNKAHEFTKLLFAESAQHLSAGRWELEIAHRHQLDVPEAALTRYVYDLATEADIKEEPYHFDRVYLDPLDLSAREVRREAIKVELIGGNARKWWTDYYFKTANPYIALVMFLFAIPLSTFSQTAVWALSFFYVLMTAFIYMVVMSIGVSFGYSGALPPPLAAWFGNIVFLVISILLYFKFRK